MWECGWGGWGIARRRLDVKKQGRPTSNGSGRRRHPWGHPTSAGPGHRNRKQGRVQNGNAPSALEGEGEVENGAGHRAGRQDTNKTLGYLSTRQSEPRKLGRTNSPYSWLSGGGGKKKKGACHSTGPRAPARSVVWLSGNSMWGKIFWGTTTGAGVNGSAERVFYAIKNFFGYNGQRKSLFHVTAVTDSHKEIRINKCGEGLPTSTAAPTQPPSPVRGVPVQRGDT